jgi:hypothetical protein
MKLLVQMGGLLGIFALALAMMAAAPLQDPEQPSGEEDGGVYFAYTYHRSDGNRLAEGKGLLPYVEPLDIPLDGQPRWLLAAPLNGGSVWVAVLADGRAQAFHVVGEEVAAVDITPSELPPGMPPLLKIEDGVPVLVGLPSPDASAATHPVVLSSSEGKLAFVDGTGDLVIQNNDGEIARLAVSALPDARLLMDERKRLLLLTDPTTRYDHGVLGDKVEAGSVTLVETEPAPRVLRRLVLPPEIVVEGIAPLWADLSGDGKREIILTLSNDDQGAQVVVFDEAGVPLAGGSPVGQGYRWRHVVAVAPLGPDGELELVDVLTPHIGGVVEFYQFGDHRLDVSAELGEYGSHSLGSRNMDSAVVGDFDGDDRQEVLVPGQSRRTLAAIRHSADGAEEIWTVPVGGLMSTNVATVPLSDGMLGAGVGHNGQAVRLWLPQQTG